MGRHEDAIENNLPTDLDLIPDTYTCHLVACTTKLVFGDCYSEDRIVVWQLDSTCKDVDCLIGRIGCLQTTEVSLEMQNADSNKQAPKMLPRPWA